MNNAPDLVSVVIPTFNRVDQLMKAIESVRNQTYKNIEIIIIDDNSTDTTEKTLLPLCSDKFYYSRNPVTKGGNYSRNLGVKNSHGEIIAFLDDDDMWIESKLEKQILIMKANNLIGLVYTGTKIIYPDKTSYNNIPKQEGDLSKKIFFHNYIGTTSTVIVKKILLVQAGFFDENLPAQQDYDLWIRLCGITNIGVVKEALVLYNNSPSSSQISNSLEKHQKAMTIINSKYKEVLTGFNEREKNNYYINQNYVLAKKSYKLNNAVKARDLIVQCLKLKLNLNLILFYFSTFLKYENTLKIRKYIKL